MSDILKEQHPIVALIAAFVLVFLIYLFAKPGTIIKVVGITFTKREDSISLPSFSVPSKSLPLDWVRFRFALHYLIKLGKYCLAFYLIPDFIDNLLGPLTYGDPEDYSVSTAFFYGTILLLIGLVKIPVAEENWVVNNAHRAAAITFTILASLVLSVLLYFFAWPQMVDSWKMQQQFAAGSVNMFLVNVTLILVVMMAIIGFVYFRRVLNGSFCSAPQTSDTVPNQHCGDR